MLTIRSVLSVLGVLVGTAFPSGAQTVPQVPADALDGLTTKVLIETIAQDGTTRFFRTGRVVHRLDPERGDRVSVVEYADASGELTGRFEIRTDPRTFALREARYEPSGLFSRARELRVEGSSLQLRQLLGFKDVGNVSSPMPPEIADLALAFLSVSPTHAVTLEMAGFGGPGEWRVRNEGSVADDDPRVESSNLWVSESGNRRVWTLPHAPWLLRFEFVDPSGVRWVHQTTCVETVGRRPVPDALRCSDGTGA